MSIFDIVIFVTLVLGAFSGFKRGLILELLTFLAFFVGIIGGFYLMHTGVDFLSEQFNLSGSFLPILSFLLIFFTIIILVNLMGKALKKVIDMTPLGSLDNVAGGVLGALKWAFTLSVLIWGASYLGMGFDSYLESSQMVPYIEPIAPVVFDFVSAFIPFLSEFFETVQEGVKA